MKSMRPRDDQHTSVSSSTTTVIPALPRGTIPVTSYIGRAPLLLGIIERGVVRDSLAFIERLETLGINGREVDKDILSTALGGNEAESLVTEKLDGSFVRHGRKMRL